MITVRWAAVSVLLVCCWVAFTGVRDWVNAGIALAAFLLVCWTFRTRRAPRPRPAYPDGDPRSMFGPHMTTAGDGQPPPRRPRR